MEKFDVDCAGHRLYIRVLKLLEQACGLSVRVPHSSTETSKLVRMVQPR